MSQSRYIVIFVVMLSIIVALQGSSCAETDIVNSKDLINRAAAFDGKTIKYRGEVVSTIMKRGEYSWLNLNDGFNAIGVWCKTISVGDVETFGDYRHEGDILEVSGIFHRACPEHGGELDIHAGSVRIEARGFSVEDHVSAKRINLAIAFFILTLLAAFILRKRI